MLLAVVSALCVAVVVVVCAAVLVVSGGEKNTGVDAVEDRENPGMQLPGRVRYLLFCEYDCVCVCTNVVVTFPPLVCICV